MAMLERFTAIRCPSDGRTLTHVTLSGRGAVRQRCHRCGQIWRIDLRTYHMTLVPPDEGAETYRRDLVLVDLAAG